MKKIQSLVFAGIFLAISAAGFARNQHAFLWDSVHGMQDLGTLGGNTSYATGINDSGVVAGYSYLSDNITTHAFLWTASGGMVDIGTSFPGSSSQANAINAAGNLAGNGIVSGQQVPAYYSSGTWQTLPRSNRDCRNFGYGINDSNQVTGQRYQGEVVHGFIWNPGGTIAYLTPIPHGGHRN